MTIDVPVSLRRFPYPYKAMLAICSDLDETPDRWVYWEIMRFLNTTQGTSMGSGVGLEVGNSIYFNMPPGQFAYWGTDDAGRAMVRTLILSGHIDCLHSFGDLATTRCHAQRALDEMVRHDCRLEVWVDHSVAPTNLGADIMRGHGDESEHSAYHADLTIPFGIRYVWRGRVSSIIGQDTTPAVRGLFNVRHPVRSSRTMAREMAKHILGRCGHTKYAMHGENRLLRVAELRDGARILEFMRSNPHWGGVSCCDTAAGLGKVLTTTVLDRLVEREGVCVLYTHLGKVSDPQMPFPESSQAAWRRLAVYHCEGRILVTTTHRSLRYVTVRDGLRFKAARQGTTVVITTDALEDPLRGDVPPQPTDLHGITFVTLAVDRAEIRLPGGSSIVPTVTTVNGTSYISVRWQALTFPQL